MAALTEGGQDVLAVVVEVQLSREPGKRWSWPVYLATVRAELHLRCPAARHLRRPCDRSVVLHTHPDGPTRLVLTPLVIGPERVPVIDTPAAARASPELAVLSALGHQVDTDRPEVLDALVMSLSTFERHRSLLYGDLVLDALSGAARRYLEEQMSTGTYEFRTEFFRRAYGEGRAEGRAEASSSC